MITGNTKREEKLFPLVGRENLQLSLTPAPGPAYAKSKLHAIVVLEKCMMMVLMMSSMENVLFRSENCLKHGTRV